MNRARQFFQNHGPLLAILLLAAVLRCVGLTWGIPTPAVPHRPFHYDEHTVMGVMRQFDLARRDFNPESAHLEGPFAFYAWEGAAIVMRALGVLDKMPNRFTGYGDPDYFRMMLAGRFVMVLFDLASLLLVYLIVRRIASRGAALLGALLFAIIPFEIIHCHFMRPHIAGNFFVCLIILLAYRVYDTKRPTLLAAISGLAIGMAIATRYHLFALAVIPYTAMVYRSVNLDSERCSPAAWFRAAVQQRVWLMAACAAAGFCLSDPYLFLDFEAARASMTSQASATTFSQFGWPGIFDLSRPWRYLVWVLPAGTVFLWIIFYASAAYCIFTREYRRYVLPLLFFVLLYGFYSTKGYGLYCIRVLLHIFPILVIWSALAIIHAWEALRGRGILRTSFAAVVGFIILATIVFDLACVTSMTWRTDDPYLQLRAYFSRPGMPPVPRVGLISLEWDRYMLPNFTTLINHDNGRKAVLTDSKTDYQNAEGAADYIILFEFDWTMTGRIRTRMDELLRSGRYRRVATFRNRPSLAGVEFDCADKPTDFRYPYPDIHLLEACAAKPGP